MVDNKEKIYETDLYKPIENYFSKLGYQVHGEVNHCDVTAIKEDEVIIIELKLSLTVDLLIQAAKRQRLTEFVYIAIPKPKYKMRSKKWQDLCHLLKRLELGLIVVTFLKTGAKMEVLFSPTPFDRTKSLKLNQHKREKLLKEINGRNGSYNSGGSSKTKIMTAYKESCIEIALLLLKLGPTSPKNLRTYGTGDKTLTILNKNYYGWFEKVARGIYKVSNKGLSEINEYPAVISYFKQTHLEIELKSTNNNVAKE